MPKTKTLSKKLPKKIFVQQHERDKHGEDWLAVCLSVEDLEEDIEEIGVYELIETKQFKVERTLR